MESITFAKLISPYPEDVTLNCPLKIENLDNNLLTLKDFDIKTATYDNSEMLISIVRNNGDFINLDISSVKDKVEEEIWPYISGSTGPCEINLDAEVSDNGILTLYWSDCTGEHSTSVSAFVEIRDLIHDNTLKGDGGDKPIGINETELTGKYKAVDGITETLPQNPQPGERYITKTQVSSFGRLYNIESIEKIKSELQGTPWRIPTKDDWDKLLTFADVCDEKITGNDVGVYQGDLCGKMLKSVDYWEGNQNLDEYGFSVFPSGYVFDTMLIDADKECRFWTDTELEPSGTTRYIKGFSYDHDNVLQEESSNEEYYSIRLVMDVDDYYSTDYANILGNTYKILIFREIKQAWISTNLIYDTQDNTSIQFSYDHEGIVSDKYILNHWDGLKWIKKQLNNGDQFNVNGKNITTEYACVEDENGNQNIIRGLVYKIENNIKKLVIDAGWF